MHDPERLPTTTFANSWTSDSVPDSHSFGLSGTATEVVTQNTDGTSTANIVVYY